MIPDSERSNWSFLSEKSLLYPFCHQILSSGDFDAAVPFPSFSAPFWINNNTFSIIFSSTIPSPTYYCVAAASTTSAKLLEWEEDEESLVFV